MEIDHQCDPTKTFLRLLVISGFLGVLFVVAGAIIIATNLRTKPKAADPPAPTLHRSGP